MVEFRPPSCAALLRALPHPRGQRELARHIVRIDACAPTRLLIRLTRPRPLLDGVDAAVRRALPADEPRADGRPAARHRQPAAEARRAELLYLAELCVEYGWTPDQARALTPREMRAMSDAARHLADLRFVRTAALHGIQLPAPPPLRLDPRDAAAARRADELARKRRPPRAHLDPAALDALLGAVATRH